MNLNLIFMTLIILLIEIIFTTDFNKLVRVKKKGTKYVYNIFIIRKRSIFLNV